MTGVVGRTRLCFRFWTSVGNGERNLTSLKPVRDSLRQITLNQFSFLGPLVMPLLNPLDVRLFDDGQQLVSDVLFRGNPPGMQNQCVLK
jgi:hypothetical protein